MRAPVVLMIACAPQLVHAQDEVRARMAGDLHAAPAVARDVRPSAFRVAGALAYVLVRQEVVNLLTARSELWVTDGTAAGTRVILDPFPLAFRADDMPQVIEPSFEGAALGDRLVFSVLRQAIGREVWITDGTVAGTRLLADIAPGPASSHPVAFTAAESAVYFAADDGGHGVELWGTDGTRTWLVADLRAGSAGSAPSSLATSGREVFFTADDGVRGRALWASDGSTVRLVAEAAGAAGSGLRVLAAAARGVVFTAGGVLWSAGDPPVRLEGPTEIDAETVAVIDGLVVFAAGTAETGLELWRTDGTPAGTALVADLRAGPEGARPRAFAATSSVAFFAADDGVHGLEPWITDGVSARLVRDLAPGAASSSPSRLTAHGVLAYFATSAGEVWRTDGTELGTARIEAEGVPLALASAGESTLALLEAGERRVLASIRGDRARTLTAFARTTGDGVRRTYELRTTPVVLEDALLFSGDDGIHGFGLWAARGDLPELELVHHLAGSAPAGLQVRGGTVDIISVSEDVSTLWTSDGTSNGTRIVRDVGDHGVPFVGVLGNVSFFVGGGLWRTDGTSDGTFRVSELGAVILGPGGYSRVGGALVFPAHDGAHHLWRSDGSRDGTARYFELETWPSLIVPALGSAYYTDARARAALVLFATDGTRDGTVAVAELPFGLAELYAAAGRLFVMIDRDPELDELWVSEGTPASTRRLVTFEHPADAVLGTEDGVYVSIADPARGNEPWIVGTTGTPTPLGDLYPGPGSSNPRTFTELDGAVLFTADDGVHGRELWISHGTRETTRLLSDTIPGPFSGGPDAYMPAPLAAGEHVYFAAVDPDRGQELHVLPRAALQPPPVADAGVEGDDAASFSADAGTGGDGAEAPGDLATTASACGCRGTRGEPAPWWLLVLLTAGAASARRRAVRARRPHTRSARRPS